MRIAAGSRAPGGDARGLQGQLCMVVRPYRFGQRFAPAPASVGIPISRCYAQRPYCLIRPHDICSKPRNFCRPIGVRHVSTPAPRSPGLSGAPGVISGLQHVLLLDGGVPRP
jgi:hypothetical protein